MLVVAYGISINLVEVTWKSKIKAQFPNPNDYSAFMGDFSTATGAVTFTMMILSRYIFRYFGWGVAALITPTVLLITGIAFFSLVLFRCARVPARVRGAERGCRHQEGSGMGAARAWLVPRWLPLTFTACAPCCSGPPLTPSPPAHFPRLPACHATTAVARPPPVAAVTLSRPRSRPWA